MSNRLNEFDENEFDEELFEQFNEDRKEEADEDSGKKKMEWTCYFLCYRRLFIPVCYCPAHNLEYRRRFRL